MNRKTANFRVLLDGNGRRYQFFCALSGAHVCTTRPIRSDTPELALELAWESEGKQYFNHCGKCGNWVIDAMYNVEVLECVDCAPYEGIPLYCKFCGEKVEAAKAVDAAGADQRLLIKEGQSDVTEKAKNLQLEQFGFGPNVMKKIKVCPRCGQIARARSIICSRCGARLPFTTLFDSYKRRHPCCPRCSTILTADTKYCPHCGQPVNTADVSDKNHF